MNAVAIENWPGMRVLTVREPWASLIVLGFKTVENRSRRFGWRGPLLIHASRALSTEYYEAAKAWAEAHVPAGTWCMPSWRECAGNRGRIVGGCTVTGCTQTGVDPWRDGSAWGLALADAWAAERTVAARGALGLWTLTAGRML
jgi:hypothetical protein